MQVAKWGNSLAVRLPSAVVGALDRNLLPYPVANTSNVECRSIPPAFATHATMSGADWSPPPFVPAQKSNRA